MRQYISSVEADNKGNLVVDGRDLKYLKQVLRLKVGNILEVRFPKGGLCSMEVQEVSFDRVLLHIKDSIQTDSKFVETGVLASNIESSILKDCPVWLIQFMPKAQKMDLIIRQAVEVGVSVILPVNSSRNQLKDSSNRNERWTRIIKEARQQSGSPVATEILPSTDLKNALSLWKKQCGNNPCSVVLYEEVNGCFSLHEAIFNSSKKEKISAVALVVGCEGGISNQELDSLKNEGFVPVHFNTNILRVETAALYGLASLQTLLMEHDKWLLKEFTY